jgi:hypothetical protein
MPETMVLTIYATGLGAVDPPVLGGTAPPATSSRPQSCDGDDRQVRAEVSAAGAWDTGSCTWSPPRCRTKVARGSDVPVALMVVGQTSPPVTMPVR